MSPYYFLIIVLLLCCQVVLTQKQTPPCGQGQKGQHSKATLTSTEAASAVDIQLDPLAKLWTSPGTYQSIDMFLTPTQIKHNGQKRFKNVVIVHSLIESVPPFHEIKEIQTACLF